MDIYVAASIAPDSRASMGVAPGMQHSGAATFHRRTTHNAFVVADIAELDDSQELCIDMICSLNTVFNNGLPDPVHT